MNPKRERHLRTEGRLLPNVTDARIRQIQRVTMALERLPRLQRRILAWLWTEDQRTRGTMAADHQDLVRALVALGFDKGNVSSSLKGLEAKGLVTIAKWRAAGKLQGDWQEAQARQVLSTNNIHLPPTPGGTVPGR